jgi:hypothetical protein
LPPLLIVTNILLSITMPSIPPFTGLVCAIIITGGTALAQSAVFAGGLGGRVMVMGLIKFWPLTQKVNASSNSVNVYFILFCFF